MSYTINTDIHKAFFDKMISAAVLDNSFPNVDFSSDKPYLRVHILPAATSSVGLRSIDIISGYCQIDIIVPNGIGSITATEYVDSVLGLFVRPMQLTSGTTTVKIVQSGWAAPAVQGDAGYFIPVSIPYLIIN